MAGSHSMANDYQQHRYICFLCAAHFMSMCEHGLNQWEKTLHKKSLLSLVQTLLTHTQDPVPHRRRISHLVMVYLPQTDTLPCHFSLVIPNNPCGICLRRKWVLHPWWWQLCNTCWIACTLTFGSLNENGCHFADDIVKYTFMIANISLDSNFIAVYPWK